MVTRVLGSTSEGLTQYVGSVAERDSLTGLVDGQQVSVSENGYVYKYVSGTDSFEILPGRFKGNDGKLYQVVSAILRQDTQASGWYTLDDAGHAPIGLDPVTPVSRLGEDIVINYNFTSQKIGSLVMVPDEGFSLAGLTFGASVGDKSAFISLYYPFWARTNGTSVVAHKYFGPKGADEDWNAVNDTGAGQWVFTHPSESHSDSAGSVVAVEGYGNDASATTYEVISRSKTGFTVEARQVIHGKTNGTSVLSDNVGPQTVSWDDVNNELTITHPESPSTNDAIVVSKSPQYNAAITASTNTTITVQFYDVSTGTLYAGSSLPTNVYYQRGGKAACALTGATQFKVQRLGRCQIDATNVGGASSNIWVYGVFEVAG